MARYIAKQTGKDVSELPYNVLTSEALKKEFGQATFFTGYRWETTDVALAWAVG